MLERGFLIFLNFYRNFHAQVEYEQNSGLNFFSLFLGLSHPVLAKNNARKRFFNFFAIFFRNFLARVENERNSGQNFFFFVVLSLSQSVSAKNKFGKRFFNFFAIFYGIFFPVPSMNGIRD